MSIGAKRRRLTLQQPSSTPDTFGQLGQSYTPTATVWGEVKDVGGREYMAASGERANVTTQITIRYRSDVGPDWQITTGGRTFDVQDALDQGGRKRELVLMCLERKA